MADLLDALHYMFEDDLAPSTGEQQEARMANRERIYTQLYENPSYEWAVKDKQRSGDDFSSAAPRVTTAAGQTVLPGMPDVPEYTHKDYIPPTDFNPDAAKPFGDVLDAPLG
jgi:hypothetical protein